MASHGVLEVIVCSGADAQSAALGGADRLEVISHYDHGGLTPSFDLVQSIAARVDLPLRVMLRESAPFVVSDIPEIEILCSAAREFAKMAIDGLVVGFLREDSQGKSIDHDLLGRVLACAPKLKATFHRAFEELHDPLRGIAELKSHRQIDRILTSGGQGTAASRWERLRDWKRAAQAEIELVIGGGTDDDAIRVLKPLGIREFHVGRAVRDGKRIDGAIVPARVRELAALIRA